MPKDEAQHLAARIKGCRLCAARFAATRTADAPRPVPWFDARARLLVAGQAPGTRVHASGRPFDDRSGARLREWLGLDEAAFYDRSRVAIVPMAFCFPGQDTRGADLAPPRVCAQTWHAQVMRALPRLRLRVVIGAHALRWHLGAHGNVTRAVADWRAHAPDCFPLPHPSWRNTAWLRRNPWFEAELVPRLREQVARVMTDD